jgi:UPF0716 protein FxsA
LLFKLAALTSPLVAILSVVVTGVVGYWLARAQGWQAYQRIRVSVEAQENPADPVVDGLLILVAGVLLMTPGMITDLVGFLLLIPLSRVIFRRQLIRYFSQRLQTVVMTQVPPPAEVVDPDVFEGVVVEDESMADEPQDDSY